MNEKDIIHNIKQQTKDLPIPDSISSGKMKEMLDSQIEKNATDSNNVSQAINIKRRRATRYFATAACVTLCLIGGLTTSKLLNWRSGRSYDENNMECAADSAAEEAYDMAESDAGTADVAPPTKDTPQTTLQSPTSYDEYYDTLKSAYDAYYDQLAEVNGVDNVSSFKRGTDKDIVYEESAAADEDFSTNTESVKDASFSTTNTQEENVDEGDIVKTDGTYIYRVSKQLNATNYENDTKLYITKAENGKLEICSSLDIDSIMGNSKELEYKCYTFDEFYLQKDYLILLYHSNSLLGYQDESTTPTTHIVVYNIKDRYNPKKMKDFTQTGYYESSRIYDGYLYTISNFSDATLSTKEPYSNYIPSINGQTISCEDIYYPQDIFMERTYVLTSLNLEHPSRFTDQKAIPAKGSSIYVSDSSIYIYGTLYQDITRTEITRIGYYKGILTPGNSATITGYLYDSFALSEYNHYLRIIATIPANNIALLRSSIDFEDDTVRTNVVEDVNALYILDENMELTGKISGIAPGETIYSARFLGDKGYFVTYRLIDPLFCVDLSNPYAPELIGELTLPGFSNYLHYYDNDLLFGLGEARDPISQGFLGLKLSMFDIKDPVSIEEKDCFIIENSQYTEAQYNHKAMLINPAKNLFGFLYSELDPNDNTYRERYYYATYSYDAKAGFTLLARYKINDGSEYNYDSVRGVFIDDYLYITTDHQITSYLIGDTAAIDVLQYQ